MRLLESEQLVRRGRRWLEWFSGPALGEEQLLISSSPDRKHWVTETDKTLDWIRTILNIS